ncbi:hypothetical protein CDL15_Pgr026346 [Punica granatum]|uniref:Uncharacterized protein n=2 Tax=Punica granatum TaxID=22663 RepID=A0A218WQN0_PUNGR|nr:hypothetical protein CDL15_Pgr026346 [Punica granatum]
MQGRNPKVNAGPEADIRSKPNAVNAGPEPDAEREPDAGPKPNAVNAGPELDAGLEPDAGPRPNAVVSTPFWLTFPNDDISNDRSHNLSRIQKNDLTEQKITIHPQVGKIGQMTHAYDRRTPGVTKG